MSASINGHPILWVSDLTWTLQVGVQPATSVFPMHRQDAIQLFSQEAKDLAPVTLALGDLVVQNLFVTRIGATTHPDMMTVELADQRWLWSKKSVMLLANMLRRSGRARWVNGQVVPFSQQVLDVDYWLWSLKGGKQPWAAAEIADELLRQIEVKTQDHLTWQRPSPPTTGEIIPQDFRADGQADVALARAIAELSGWDIYVDLEGNVQWVDTRSLSDISIATGLTKIAETQLPTIADRRYERPREIHLLYEPECELRFNNRAFDLGSGAASQGADDSEAELELLNVIPIPLPELDVNGSTRTAGEFAFADDFLTATQALTRRNFAPALTHQVVRMLWAARRLNMIYVAPYPGIPADTDWALIIGTLYAHYLTTWQIVRQWRDRIRSWRAYRVGVIDVETGTLAVSKPFLDHAIVWGMPPAWRNLSDERLMATNITCFATRLEGCRGGHFRCRRRSGDLQGRPQCRPLGRRRRGLPVEDRRRHDPEHVAVVGQRRKEVCGGQLSRIHGPRRRPQVGGGPLLHSFATLAAPHRGLARGR